MYRELTIQLDKAVDEKRRKVLELVVEQFLNQNIVETSSYEFLEALTRDHQLPGFLRDMFGESSMDPMKVHYWVNQTFKTLVTLGYLKESRLGTFTLTREALKIKRKPK